HIGVGCVPRFGSVGIGQGGLVLNGFGSRILYPIHRADATRKRLRSEAFSTYISIAYFRLRTCGHCSLMAASHRSFCAFPEGAPDPLTTKPASRSSARRWRSPRQKPAIPALTKGGKAGDRFPAR